MEGIANLVVYRNGEIIHNTHEGVTLIPCRSLIKRVCRICLKIHRQTQMRHPQIELYVEFEAVEAIAVQNDIDIDDDRDAMYEGMNSDSEEKFEATYEASDEDEDGDVGVEAAVENLVVHPSSSQPMYVLPFMRIDDPEDGEFQIGMEYSFRKSIVAAIRSFTISRGVDYDVYESEPQTFYAKCKILIRKKGCWEIRRYNDRHMCTIETISQDHFKLDSDTVAEAIRLLVETDPSMTVGRWLWYIIRKRLKHCMLRVPLDTLERQQRNNDVIHLKMGM
ncbi:hypothetical protein Ahy_A08g039807 [Arachis hypogaea]|uniref:Transposase MuDR plant domain-containing protein n=1 Tax=Arachis hypogaea TaxID=3818 RepID=A0A445BXC5_ARAHY|nr:hypothetical protein Ahy_A08g039807 [Arachis hypogaea]